MDIRSLHGIMADVSCLEIIRPFLSQINAAVIGKAKVFFGILSNDGENHESSEIVD
jgi:hypothetical protein